MQFMSKSSRCFAILAILCFPFSFRLDGQETPKAAPTKPDYSKEAFVDEDDTSKLSFENDGTCSRETSRRIRVQSDAGVQHFGVLTFPYQSANESVEIEYVRVRKPDGSVVTTPNDSAQDMPSEVTRQAPFYSDLHEKHFAVRGLAPGDTLEYAAWWHLAKPLAPGQFWFAHNFSHDFIVLHEELQVSIPKDRAVKWKSPNNQPKIVEDAGRRIFTWTSSQLQQKSDDEQKKEAEDKLYYTAKGKLPPPDVQMSTFQTWAEVGAWYNSLQSERVKPGQEIRAKAAELTKDAKDDDAKLHAIYTYVSTQFRYIGVAFGIGRYQPHSADEVLANQYGDCKDKHTLLASLLEAVGIKSYPALINATHDLDPDVPSPAQFDHVITVVPKGEGLVWLDTTAEVAPYGYLLNVLREKRALAIPPNHTAELVDTEAYSVVSALQTFKMEAKLSREGTLDGKVETSVSGDDTAVLIRAALRRTPMPQWKDLVQRISYATGFSGDVSQVTASSPEKIDEAVSWSYHYNRKDYPDWANHRITSPTPNIPMPDTVTKPTHPVLLGPIERLHYQSFVELPSGYQPQLPAKVDLKETFAEYHSFSSFSKGVLRTDRQLVTKVRELSLSDYEAYKRFAKAVFDDRDTYIYLSAGLSDRDAYQSAIWSLPDSENAEAMRQYGIANSEVSRSVLAAIEALKRAVELDPKFVRAWLWMGQLCVFRRDYESALDAYRKAVDADPHQPLSYKFLAMGLTSSHKYTDSADVWRRLIAAVPDDADAPAGLAGALFSLERYSEAADAYESALKLNPDRPVLLSQLGMAYLRAGNEDKAIAAYKRTVELDPQPLWFNNIAYALANANKQIPLALQYADRAVREEEEKSATVKLSQLKKDDLAYTLSLPAYWDTLGWVHFRLGDFEKAEKYLMAAWIVLQDPTAADHVGQVYEAQHRNDKAIEMYRLAIAASRNPGSAKDTEGRLAHLTEHSKSKEPAVKRAELSQMRTFKLPKLSQDTSAEFFVLLASGSKVLDVKQVSGPLEFKDAEKAISSTSFEIPFPDDGPGVLVRRGLLSCHQISGCDFVLYSPYDVHSVE